MGYLTGDDHDEAHEGGEGHVREVAGERVRLALVVQVHTAQRQVGEQTTVGEVFRGIRVVRDEAYLCERFGHLMRLKQKSVRMSQLHSSR